MQNNKCKFNGQRNDINTKCNSVNKKKKKKKPK